MLVAIREGDDFCFDAGAIAWSDALDLSVVERRFRQSAAQHLVNVGIGLASPARKLRQGAQGTDVGETVVVCFAWLLRHKIKMYRAGIDSDGCACFHAGGADAMFRDGIGQKSSCWLRATASFHLSAAYVHQSVQESACGDDYGARFEASAPHGLDSANSSLFNDDFCGFVLPHIQVGRIFQPASPFLDEARAVTLCPWAPHGRSFRTVQHAELYGAGVRHFARAAAECIYFADNLSFRDAADGRVAAHLRYLVHVHRDEAGTCAQQRGGSGSLASGVSCAHDNDVIVECSRHVIGICGRKNTDFFRLCRCWALLCRIQWPSAACQQRRCGPTVILYTSYAIARQEFDQVLHLQFEEDSRCFGVGQSCASQQVIDG